MRAGSGKFSLWTKTALAGAVLVALSGCSLLERLFPAGEPAPAGAAADDKAVISPDGLAPLSEDQSKQIRAALTAQKVGPATTRARREAVQTIRDFVAVHGCITGHNGAVLNPWAAPGQLFDAKAYDGAPMAHMKFHDRTACTTVQRFQNWKMPTRSTLRFEVVYRGDDGEETATTQHELTRQRNGLWRFTR